MSPGKARPTTKERISLMRKSKFTIATATTMLALLGVTNFDKSGHWLFPRKDCLGRILAAGDIRAFCRRFQQFLSEPFVTSASVRYILYRATFLKTWIASKPYRRNKKRYAEHQQCRPEPELVCKFLS
jgi:hypothetical protein